MKVSPILTENMEFFSHRINMSNNFDVIKRRFDMADRESCVFFCDGFVQEDTVSKLFESLSKFKGMKCPESADEFVRQVIVFGDVSVSDDFDNITLALLCGSVVMFIDRYESAVLIDFRSYGVQRSTAEPSRENVARGARDAFVERALTNVTLLRRRLRSAAFSSEVFQVGSTTKTDVVVCYLADRVDRPLLKNVRKNIAALKIDNLSMSQQTLSNKLMGGRIINPFPKFRYTERPDVAVSQILRGDVIIVVDNSPQVIMLPVSFFDVMEEPNDYYFPSVTGTYLRLIRYLTALLSVYLTPVWLAALSTPDILPERLSFILVKHPASIPLILQLLILEVLIDGFKLASLNTPALMTTTLSVLGAIVIGNVSVSVGWFCAESVLYMGIIALANFSLPSYEMSYAFKFSRITMLILTWFIGWWGILLGTVIMFAAMLFNKTLAGYKFLYPLIPFNAKELKRLTLKLFRGE